MAETNIRLLASKIAALDVHAQHAVEIAVDSLLDDAGLRPEVVMDARVDTLERRVDALGEQRRGDEVVFLDDYDRDHPDFKLAIELLITAAQRALDVLTRTDAAAHAV